MGRGKLRTGFTESMDSTKILLIFHYDITIRIIGIKYNLSSDIQVSIYPWEIQNQLSLRNRGEIPESMENPEKFFIISEINDII